MYDVSVEKVFLLVKAYNKVPFPKLIEVLVRAQLGPLVTLFSGKIKIIKINSRTFRLRPIMIIKLTKDDKSVKIIKTLKYVSW